MDSSILFIGSSSDQDSGEYKFTIFDNGFIATTTISVLIIEIPSIPTSLVVTEHTQNSILLEWNPPLYSGGVDLVGYQVEKRDKKSDCWYIVYDRVRHCNCVVSNLVAGNEYKFRVKVNSLCSKRSNLLF